MKMKTVLPVSLISIITIAVMLALICCSTPNTQYIQTITTTYDSVTFLAKKVKALCDNGQLDEQSCNKIRGIYSKIKSVDDRIIDITQESIKLGDKDLYSNPDYAAAMSELSELIGKLITTATDLGVIGGGAR